MYARIYVCTSSLAQKKQGLSSPVIVLPCTFLIGKIVFLSRNRVAAASVTALGAGVARTRRELAALDARPLALAVDAG